MNDFRQAVSELAGAAVAETRPLAGGDLSQVLLLRLADDRRLVAKRTPAARAEAAMLSAIRTAGVAAPEVLGATDEVLLMSCVEHDGNFSAAAWSDIGAQLAMLHATRGERYGWEQDYGFGEVPIRNRWSDSWPTFWGERRLIATAEGVAPEWRARIEQLARRIGDLLPRSPPPSLLHGDLWGGNILVAQGRLAAMIDPACHYGHCEVDLAMLTLFGSPSECFWRAYGPLDDGWQERRALYQLFPALVHLRLFGSGYAGMIDRLLRAVGA